MGGRTGKRELNRASGDAKFYQALSRYNRAHRLLELADGVSREHMTADQRRILDACCRMRE